MKRNTRKNDTQIKALGHFRLELQKDGTKKKIDHYTEHKKAVQSQHILKQCQHILKQFRAHQRAIARKISKQIDLIEFKSASSTSVSKSKKLKKDK